MTCFLHCNHRGFPMAATQSQSNVHLIMTTWMTKFEERVVCLERVCQGFRNAIPRGSVSSEIMLVRTLWPPIGRGTLLGGVSWSERTFL